MPAGDDSRPDDPDSSRSNQSPDGGAGEPSAAPDTNAGAHRAVPDRFGNEPIGVPGIPTLDHEAFSHLDPRYRVVRLVSVGMSGVVPVVATIVGSLALPLPPALERVAIAAAALWFLAGLAVAWFEFPYRGWLLREHDVSFRRGIIGRSITTVPFSRVQHVAVSRSGVSRAFGLASVDLFTAGSGIADLSIPGLELGQAERLREHVLAVIRVGPG
jgi:membrane protein YdbS with pleckstrin-like domain